MKKRILALVLAISTLMSVLVGPSVSLAELMKAQDDRVKEITVDKQHKIASNDLVTVLKSAEWTDNEKENARITIEVQSDEMKEETEGIHDADIIFILDKSLSAGRNINLQHNAMIDLVMKDATKHFITGEFKDRNNQIAYAEFSSALLVWDGSFPGNSNSSNTYSKEENHAIHYYNRVYGGKNGKNETITLTYDQGNYGFNYSHSNGKSESFNKQIAGNFGYLTEYGQINYEQAKYRFSTIMKAYPEALKFYSGTKTDLEYLDRVFEKSKYFENGGYGSLNTNFDMGLFYAQTLLDSRENADRQSYVIFVTDGTPFPNIRYSNVTYQAHGSKAGKDADNVANLFYKNISEDLRNKGTEIYAIIIDTTNEGASQVVTEPSGYAHVTEETTGKNWYTIVWDVITGDTGSGKDANTEHIYSITNEKKDQSVSVDAMKDVFSKIEEKMKKSSSAPVPFKAKLTDIVNTELFDIKQLGDGSASINANVGNVTVEGDTVSWNIEGVNFGQKIDGKWPTLTIDIELKDKEYDSSERGDLNTNSTIGGDDKCKIEYEDPTKEENPTEEVKVETPWLERTLNSYTVTVKYINKNTNEELIPSKSKIIKEGREFPDDEKSIKSEYLIEKLDLNIYSDDKEGIFDLAEITIDGKKCDKSEIPDTLTVNKDREIVFKYVPAPAKVVVRKYKVTMVNDDKTFLLPTFVDSSEKTVQSGKKLTETPTAMDGCTFIGSDINYQSAAPFVDADTISKLSLDKVELKDGKVNYTLDNEHSTVYIDFFYLEKVYTVTVKYVDIDDESVELIDEVNDARKDGEYYTPKVYDQIITLYKGTYDYVERDDGKNKRDDIGPINEKTVVVMKYKKRAHDIIIHYKDIETDEPIAGDERIPGVAEYSSHAPIEPSISGDYVWEERSDRKGRYDEIEVEDRDVEVTFYYRHVDPVESEPVVSYPYTNSIYKEDGKDVATLGEAFEIIIPAEGSHPQADNAGIEKPAGGWNVQYAKSEYLMFTCDVVYNNRLYKAGDKILVKQNTSGGIGDVKVSVIIPEYVEEKDYTLSAIVSSLDSNIAEGTKHYNDLLTETEAVGKIDFRVKGKIYDFTIANLAGDQFWSASLFDNTNEYKAGANASKKILQLPIGQSTKQNSVYKYGIALGSSFFYNLNTIGAKNTAVSITPKLLYIDSTGRQKDVDIYSINKLFPTNNEAELKTKLNNDMYKQRTNLAKELESGLKLFGKDVGYNTSNSIGTFKAITLGSSVKTPFVNYFTEEAKPYHSSLTSSVKDDIQKTVNHWYGYYSLPYTTKVMEKGASINDSSKELKNGYIVVLFKIESKDASGKTYLVYDNQGVGNQWYNEGGTENVEVKLPMTSANTSGITTTIKVENGYYPVAVYGQNGLNYDTSGIY